MEAEPKRVLIIEKDVETQQLLTQAVLGTTDHRPLTASSSEEGMKLIHEKHPELIILNLQLDGLAVLKNLRDQDFDIPVILTSPQPSPELVVRAFRQGARDYVIKPISPKEMEETIQRVLTNVHSHERHKQLTQELQKANDQLERQLQELNTLYTIGRSVTSLLDLDRVLNRVVEAAVYTTGAEEGMLMLLDEGGEQLYLRAAKEIDERTARNLRVRVDDSAAGRALRLDRPVHLGGDQAKIATGYLVKSLLYVPVRVPGRGPIGVLGVTNRKAKKGFSERDIHLLSALTDYASIAIENAKLFKEIEVERAKLESVLREAEESIIVVDEESKILLCNAAARTALNLDDEDLTSQPADEVLPNPAMREMFTHRREAKRTVHREIALNNGRTFNAQLTPVEGVGRVLVMQDITHIKELNRIKSEFVATVSHDLRTPLTSIQGYVSLLPKVGPLNEQQQKFIERVDESMSTITDLISDLLDIGRIEAGLSLDMEPCDLLTIIEDVIKEIRPRAAEKQQDLHLDLPKSLPTIQGNERRLHQVVSNLLSNAIKYTPEGGQISLDAVEDAGYIMVDVSDNGIGIPPEQQPYIFDKFYRVETEETMDAEGTGLGLAIVKTVIEKHNGRVWVESKPGEGSIFTFILPVLDQESEIASA